MSINSTAKITKVFGEVLSESQIPLRKIVVALNDKGYAQREIAEWAGVDVAMINRWIKKGRNEK